MQSKLPVRIKRKQGPKEKKKCCCSQLLKIIMENSSDFKPSEDDEEEVLEIKHKKTKSTQTEICEYYFESVQKPYHEIKGILISINLIMEEILSSLKDKKEVLVNKLQEVPLNNSKMQFDKNKHEKCKKKSKNQIYGWPEISRLYYGQPLCTKNYMQKLSPASSNSLLYLRPHNWICTRPMSCSDINYFQFMTKLLTKPPLSGTPVRQNSVCAFIGPGDDHRKKFIASQENFKENINFE